MRKSLVLVLFVFWNAVLRLCTLVSTSAIEGWVNLSRDWGWNTMFWENLSEDTWVFFGWEFLDDDQSR